MSITARLITASAYVGRKGIIVADEIIHRMYHGVLTGQSACSAVMHIALFILNGSWDLVATLTTGNNRHIGRATSEMAKGSGAAIQNVYLNGLRILYPGAKIEEEAKFPLTYENEKVYNTPGSEIFSERCFTYAELPALITRYVIQQQMLIHYLNQSPWWIHRNISARLVAPLSSLAGLVWGAAVLVFNFVPIIASFFTLGTLQEYNTWAHKNLRTSGWMLSQIHLGLIGCVRPDLI